jgi:hypothetical protein
MFYCVISLMVDFIFFSRLLLLDLWTLSVVWNSDNTFRNLDMFLSSGEKLGVVYLLSSVLRIFTSGRKQIQFLKRLFLSARW